MVVLRQCLDVLSDPNVSTCTKNDALKTLRTSVLPLLESGSAVARKAASGGTSMASMSVAYDRISRREKRNVVDRRSEKPAAVQMIQHSVVKFNSMTKKKAPPLPPPPLPLPPAISAEADVTFDYYSPLPAPPTEISTKAEVTLDLPNNLTEYTKLEAVIQLRKTIRSSYERK